MDFAYDARTEELRGQLQAFIDEHILPAEPIFEEQAAKLASEGRGWERPPIMDDLKAKARAPRAVEPVPGPPPGGRRADQPPVRAAGRDQRPVVPHPGGAELRGARHRQHGGAGRVRHQGAAGALAAAAARRRDPVGLLHDRAGRGLLGRDQHRHQHRARRRRLRDQRPQVVVIGGDGPALPDPDRDGQDQPRARSGTGSSRRSWCRGTLPASTSSAACTCSATPTAPTAATPRSCSPTSGCRPRT